MTYSASNIPETSPNNMAKYITNMTIAGAGFTPIRLPLQWNTRMVIFTAAILSLDNSQTYYLNIYYYNQPSGGTAQWTNTTGLNTPIVSNPPPPNLWSRCSNTTVVKTTAIGSGTLGAGIYPLNLGVRNADGGSGVSSTWIWTGGAGTTTWATSTNWSPAGPPSSTSSTNIIINPATAQPTMIANQLVNNLIINPGAILTIQVPPPDNKRNFHEQ